MCICLNPSVRQSFIDIKVFQKQASNSDMAISHVISSVTEKHLRAGMCQRKDDGAFPVSLLQYFSSSSPSWPSVVLTAVWADAGGGNSILDYSG